MAAAGGPRQPQRGWRPTGRRSSAHARFGLVLLDEDVQRMLHGADARGKATRSRSDGAAPSTQPTPRQHVDASTPVRTDFTTSGAAHQRPANMRMPPGYAYHHHIHLNGENEEEDDGDRGDDGMGELHLVSHAPSPYVGTSSGLNISVTYIMVGVILGLTLGVVLCILETSDLVTKWISLPGELFLRALKCLVVPYIFCSVAVAIGDIVFVGKVSVVGAQTIRVFMTIWVATTAMGVCVALAFRSQFRLGHIVKMAAPNSVALTCANRNQLELQANGSVACTGIKSPGAEVNQTSLFAITDLNDVFAKNRDATLAQLSISEQLQATLASFISDNIFASMAKAELLSIITFAMVLGAIAGRSYFTKTRRVNYLYLVLLQLRNTFFLAMEWIIWLTPGAVISLIAGSFASNRVSLDGLRDAYMYVLAVVAAACIQFFVLLPIVVFLLTRCNPYTHMLKMVRAYAFAFACSSSLATAPVTLTCVKKAKVCSQSLANFVISLGVCSNTSAAGFYFPIAVLFLAESAGIDTSEITAVRLVVLFVLSLLASAGTPPIPAAGLVVTVTIYKTVFGVSELPATFPLLIAVDFFVDRISTVCNVNDDVMALKVIAENTDETITAEYLGERF